MSAILPVAIRRLVVYSARIVVLTKNTPSDRPSHCKWDEEMLVQ